MTWEILHKAILARHKSKPVEVDVPLGKYTTLQIEDYSFSTTGNGQLEVFLENDYKPISELTHEEEAKIFQAVKPYMNKEFFQELPKFYRLRANLVVNLWNEYMG